MPALIFETSARVSRHIRSVTMKDHRRFLLCGRRGATTKAVVSMQGDASSSKAVARGDSDKNRAASVATTMNGHAATVKQERRFLLCMGGCGTTKAVVVMDSDDASPSPKSVARLDDQAVASSSSGSSSQASSVVSFHAKQQRRFLSKTHRDAFHRRAWATRLALHGRPSHTPTLVVDTNVASSEASSMHDSQVYLDDDAPVEQQVSPLSGASSVLGWISNHLRQVGTARAGEVTGRVIDVSDKNPSPVSDMSGDWQQDPAGDEEGSI